MASVGYSVGRSSGTPFTPNQTCSCALLSSARHHWQSFSSHWSRPSIIKPTSDSIGFAFSFHLTVTCRRLLQLLKRWLKTSVLMSVSVSVCVCVCLCRLVHVLCLCCCLCLHCYRSFCPCIGDITADCMGSAHCYRSWQPSRGGRPPGSLPILRRMWEAPLLGARSALVSWRWLSYVLPLFGSSKYFPLCWILYSWSAGGE